ncbi:MAG: hypothetical protein AAFS10_23095 [Myxococcota bacterium]
MQSTVVTTSEGKVTVSAASGGVAGEASPELKQLIQTSWQQLDRTRNTCKDQFDYHPDGGLRIFACHLFALQPYTTLGDHFGGSIFARGPHTNTTLALGELQDFGHYNPAFVDWLVAHAIPAAEDPQFRRATAPLYNTYVKPLADIFMATLNKIEREPDCFAVERDTYAKLLQQKRLPEYHYEKFFFFMNPGFCANPNGGFAAFHNNGFDGGYSGNVVKSAVAFWIRRDLDGTFRRFARGLRLLVRTYEGPP